MSGAVVRLGVGTRLRYDGEVVEVVELLGTAAGNEVVLRSAAGRRVVRVSVREVLTGYRSGMGPDLRHTVIGPPPAPLTMPAAKVIVWLRLRSRSWTLCAASTAAQASSYCLL